MARGIGERDGDRSLGGRLTQARIARGLTQQALAERAGTSQAVIQRIETGKCSLPRILETVAEVLEVEAAWLLYGVRVIEELDSEAVELARCWARLPREQRERLRRAIEDRLRLQREQALAAPGSRLQWSAPSQELRRTG